MNENNGNTTLGNGLEIKTVLQTRKVYLTSDRRLEVYNHLLATKLNKHLKVYDDGKYRFRSGEEAVFRLLPAEINFILTKFLTKKPRKSKCQVIKIVGEK